MLVESLSGVRGLANVELTSSVASRYAASFLGFLSKKKKGNITIVLGMDTRESGPLIKDAMIPYLACDIIDVGTLATPAIEQAVRHFGADGGIIITASHNEPQFNGLKFLGSDGAVLEEKMMEKVIAAASRMKSSSLNTFLSKHALILSKRTITQSRKEAIDSYRDFVFRIIGKIDLARIKNAKLKVVIDPNGGTGTLSKHILERAGVGVIPLNMVPGNFAHRVEPTKDSLFHLSAIIKKENAQFGAGFDCDADRVEIVLGNGRMLSGNELIALGAKHVLIKSKDPEKEVIVVNDATSNLIHDIARQFGAKVIEVEVGESNVVSMMRKHKSAIGGEGSSSGIILAPQTCRDGILGVLLILAIIAKSKKSLEALLESLPKRSYLKQKAGIDPKKAPKVMKKILAHYNKRNARIKSSMKGSIKLLIGKDAFVWFRMSRTENGLLRIIVDSNDEQNSQNLMDEAVSLVK
ncbi:MAG TPA: hypothetical protein VJB12_03280 [Candidatus Nanoarchaeia archaeon]|nr:hypothetical protein [Candidatus Nanoarchaeia archaeon]